MVDATGLVVAPGFLDVHAHSDLRRNPRAQSKVFQGVVLDVVGPDGGSRFPEDPADPDGEPTPAACPDFSARADQHGPIESARVSGAPLLISHLKVGGSPNWHKLESVLERIEAARAEGLDVHADAYPYEAWSTGLATNFPGWAKEEGHFIARLRDPAERARMHEPTARAVAANRGWGALMLGRGLGAADRALAGQRIDAAARQLGVEPFELACDLLTRGNVSILGARVPGDHSAQHAPSHPGHRRTVHLGV